MNFAQCRSAPPQDPPGEDRLQQRPNPTHGPEGRGAEFADQDFFWFNDVDGTAQWGDPYAVLTDGAPRAAL